MTYYYVQWYYEGIGWWMSIDPPVCIRYFRKAMESYMARRMADPLSVERWRLIQVSNGDQKVVTEMYKEYVR